MAIQAQMYPENLGLPISSQDYFFIENNNFFNNNINNNMSNINNNNLLFLQYQQQQQQLQQQQEYLFRLQNMHKRNVCINNNSCVFSQPSKKQKIVATTVTTASTTTSDSNFSNNNNNNNNNNQNNKNDIGMSFSRSFSEQLEKQSQEIDRFVTLQNERLRLALQEQRRQQMISIIKKIEAKAIQIIQQKDEQIIEARKKSMEFQQIVEKLELQNQIWQKVALENETMVLSLNNTLEQLNQQQQNQQQVEDLQDVCSSSSSSNCVVDKKEETCNKNNNQETKKGVLDLCKMCKSREMCVVILPCRHLSCCSVCEAVVENCPVCNSPKMASIQVFM